MDSKTDKWVLEEARVSRNERLAESNEAQLLGKKTIWGTKMNQEDRKTENNTTEQHHRPDENESLKTTRNRELN